MSKQDQEIKEEITTKPDPVSALDLVLKDHEEAAIICKTKENNPNYLSIISANEKFCEIFAISDYNLIGKSYDFLFNDLDLDYSSDDQLEYVRLIKAVKDFHPCAILVSLPDKSVDGFSKIKFRINFEPRKEFSTETTHYAILYFEKIANEEPSSNPKNDFKQNANIVLLRNLERSLRNERLLREIGNLIISDMSVSEISQNIARLLCQHLKTDRCIIHDYRTGITNFVVEYHDVSSKPMFTGNQDQEGLVKLTKYINFQNHFYEKFGNKTKKSSLSIVEDVATDHNFAEIENICKEFSIQSQVAVSTILNHSLNGGIYLHQSTKRVWLQDEIDLIEIIADQFAISLDRAASIEKVMTTNHALMEKTAQLKEALKQEQEMRKMQNDFVALVSHEFKTPLQIIDSTREVLSRKMKSQNVFDESIQKSLDRIKSGVTRMGSLITSTLNLAKMESGESQIKLERVTFDLKKFVEDIIEKNMPLAVNKNIKLLIKIDDLPQDFSGDPKLLEHSVTNVISNAIKYSRNDTSVKILAKSNNEKVGLRVIDQGIGIPKEDLKNIGKKFFRAGNTLAVAGTGIGLYLSKYFIELHGGDLLIESEMNVGSTFTLVLPKTPSQTTN